MDQSLLASLLTLPIRVLSSSYEGGFYDVDSASLELDGQRTHLSQTKQLLDKRHCH